MQFSLPLYRPLSVSLSLCDFYLCLGSSVNGLSAAAAAAAGSLQIRWLVTKLEAEENRSHKMEQNWDLAIKMQWQILSVSERENQAIVCWPKSQQMIFTICCRLSSPVSYFAYRPSFRCTRSCSSRKKKNLFELHCSSNRIGKAETKTTHIDTERKR